MEFLYRWCDFFPQGNNISNTNFGKVPRGDMRNMNCWSMISSKQSKKVLHIFFFISFGGRTENLMQNHLGGWSFCQQDSKSCSKKSYKTHWKEIFRWMVTFWIQNLGLQKTIHKSHVFGLHIFCSISKDPAFSIITVSWIHLSCLFTVIPGQNLRPFTSIPYSFKWLKSQNLKQPSMREHAAIAVVW